MKKAAILLDSSSTYDGYTLNDIFVIPLKIILNDENIIEYYDGKDISSDVIYSWVQEGKNLTTSQPSIGEAIEKIEELLLDYKYVYVIPIAKEISGAYNSFLSIARQIGDERVIVIDSGFLGIKILNDLAPIILNKSNNGESPVEIINYINNVWKNKFYTCVIVNDIAHLKKGGRISKISSFFANLFKVKIILTFKNKLDLYDKKNSLKEAIYSVMEKINTDLDFLNNNINKINIISNNKDEDFLEVEKNILEWMNLKKINFDKKLINKSYLLPSVITIHTGINTLVISTEIK
ncbi:MAG: DegV family protein [Mycoplasmoidaceae bacterium]